jgi:drug/metabolite transporter (DMT)-like permease
MGIWAALDELGRWGWHEWALVWASGFAHLLYFNVLLKGYRVSDLSVVYPVARGTGPLLSALTSLLVLGETMGLAGALGVLAVCGGIWLIAGGPALWRSVREPRAAARRGELPLGGTGPQATGRPRDPAQRQRVQAGLRWGALTGVLIATYTVIDGYAVKLLLVSPILVDYFGNLVRIPFMLPKCWRDRAAWPTAWRAQWRHALVVATLGPLAYVLVLYAARLAPLSHVAPAREVSMLFAALLGGRLLGESDRGLRLLGAAGMAAGVVLLALG